LESQEPKGQGPNIEAESREQRCTSWGGAGRRAQPRKQTLWVMKTP